MSLFFSPLSINVALGMIAAGANGTTRNQLLAYLKSESTKDFNTFYSHIVNVTFADSSPFGGPRLSVANGAWIEETLSLKPSFKRVANNVYKAVCESVDFINKAAKVEEQVNSWAEKETNGLIKGVIPHGTVDSETRFVLANALYFKGSWTEKFDVSGTTDREFHLLNGNSVLVSFKTSRNEQYVKAYDGFKVLKLPYRQGKDTQRHFSMYFFLPDSKDGLPSLMDAISSGSGFLERHLPDRQVSVGEFRIPKFKVSFDFVASSVLKELGVELSPLMEIVNSPMELTVSKILHKSFVEVNEEGTEASAVT